jgi:predicted metallopeptidase
MIEQVEGFVPVETPRGRLLIRPDEWEPLRAMVEEGFGGQLEVGARIMVVTGPNGEVLREDPFYVVQVSAESTSMPVLLERVQHFIREVSERHLPPSHAANDAESATGNQIRASIQKIVKQQVDDDLPSAA